MQLLRNLGELTRLLILRETSIRRHAVQRTIAEELHMTVRGVSESRRAMEKDGLIQVVDGEYRPTIGGVRVLHERFRDLRDFGDRTSKNLAIIEVTAAVAGNRIARGERVALFMEGGDLVAYAGRESPSMGRAGQPADRGGDLGGGRPTPQREGGPGGSGPSRGSPHSPGPPPPPPGARPPRPAGAGWSSWSG